MRFVQTFVCPFDDVQRFPGQSLLNQLPPWYATILSSNLEYLPETGLRLAALRQRSIRHNTRKSDGYRNDIGGGGLWSKGEG